MPIDEYRVAERTDPSGSKCWSLWSDGKQRWIDVVYRDRREAVAMLAHLVATADRRGRHRYDAAA